MSGRLHYVWGHPQYVWSVRIWLRLTSEGANLSSSAFASSQSPSWSLLHSLVIILPVLVNNFPGVGDLHFLWISRCGPASILNTTHFTRMKKARSLIWRSKLIQARVMVAAPRWQGCRWRSQRRMLFFICFLLSGESIGEGIVRWTSKKDGIDINQKEVSLLSQWL